MTRNHLPKLRSSARIYKERGEFDFLDFILGYLKEKSDNGLITRPRFYKFIGIRFSFRKHIVKQIFKDMQSHGLVKNRKRDILLLGDDDG